MSEVGKQVEARTKAHADDVKAQLEELASDFGGRYWKLGLLVSEVKRGSLWEVLGYETETLFREAVKIGRSTYYRCRRLAMEIAEPLMKKELITRARLNRLTLENAEQLLRLDVRRRFSESWVEKAITLTESEFEAQVDHVVNNDTEPEEADVDSLATIKIRCTASQKAVILDTFTEFARAQDPPLEIDDYAKILEFICADVHNELQTEMETTAR